MLTAAIGKARVAVGQDDGMRLVASDLDGTIVRSDLTMSPRTLAALAACAERGVQVVFVTGRPPRWMGPIAEATGHRGLAICSNGALLYDLAREAAVATRLLVAQSAHEAVQALRARMPEVVFAVETLAGFRREPDYLPRHEVARLAPTGTVHELLADDPQILKLLCRSEERTADVMLDLARDVLTGIAEPVHSDPASSMLEISALGVTKASMLAELAALLGISPSEVVAFGDMPNDAAMLRWAGTSYAMTGGHPEALAAADEVAPSCEEDGVAQVLEQLLTGAWAGPPMPGRRTTRGGGRDTERQ